MTSSYCAMCMHAWLLFKITNAAIYNILGNTDNTHTFYMYTHYIHYTIVKHFDGNLILNTPVIIIIIIIIHTLCVTFLHTFVSQEKSVPIDLGWESDISIVGRRSSTVTSILPSSECIRLAKYTPL